MNIRNMTIKCILLFLMAVAGNAVPASEIAKDEILVRISLVDPDGAVMPQDQIPEPLPVMGSIEFHRGEGQGVPKIPMGGADVEPIERTQEGYYRYQGKLPRHIIENIKKEGGDGVLATFVARIEGTKDFPYTGQARVTNIEEGKSYDLKVPMELSDRFLSKNPQVITVRLLSSATGKPLVGWRLGGNRRPGEQSPRGIENRPVTDENGVTEVLVPDVDSGVLIGIERGPGIWGIHPEKVSQRISAEDIRRSVENNQPITIRSNEPLMIFRVHGVDETGYLTLKIPLGNQAQRHESIPVRFGYGVLYRDDLKRSLRNTSLDLDDALESGKVVEIITNSKSFLGYRVSENALEIPDGEPSYTLNVHLEKDEPRDMKIRVESADSSLPLSNAIVEVEARGDKKFSAKANTDGKGLAVLESVPWVALTISVNADGYGAIEERTSSPAVPNKKYILHPLKDVFIIIDEAVSDQIDAPFFVYKDLNGDPQIHVGETVNNESYKIKEVPSRDGLVVLYGKQGRVCGLKTVPSDAEKVHMRPSQTEIPVSIHWSNLPEDGERGYELSILDAATGVPLLKNPGVGLPEEPAKVLWLDRPIALYAYFPSFGPRGRTIKLGTIENGEEPVEFRIDFEHESPDQEGRQIPLWHGVP